MRVICRYARQIAEKFRQETIILFGSRAWATPHEDSDVDHMVIMPARNELDQALKIRLAFNTPFPLDLLVRKRSELNWRLAEGESFSTEMVSKGKVCMKRSTQEESGCPRRHRHGQESSQINKSNLAVFLFHFQVPRRYNPGE